ncbi:MAG: response regulator transcription factor [Prevotella sp.]|nr:response regulator transcription factor [Prevotella sp.]
MIRVHITDDHRMLVEGLSAAIRESGIAEVTGTSHLLDDCRKACAVQQPDVLLLDINMPDGNGIDFCEEMHNRYSAIKILMLTSYSEFTVAKRAIDAGASGYILKNALSEEVVKGIETVAKGQTFLSHEIDLLMRRSPDRSIWLTAREQEMLRYIVDGYTNQEIADRMFLSIETIKTYRKYLIQKLGARNSMELVKLAIQDKWI